MGIGRQTTPLAFKNSCDVFTHTENLDLPETETNYLVEVPIESKASKSKNLKQIPIIKHKSDSKEIQKNTKEKISIQEIDKIDKAFDLATDEEDGTYISKVGGILRQIDPTFDPRSYGYKNLSQLLEDIDKYIVVKNEVNGLNHPLVKLK
jgi:hypothetical protein